MTTTDVDHDVLAYSNCPVPNALLTVLESNLLAGNGISLNVLSGAQVLTVSRDGDHAVVIRH